MITLLQLQAIVGRRTPEIEEMYEPLIEAMAAYEIDTPLREAMFLAQVIHETAGFHYKEEIASGEAYEGREDLGNTEPGDGPRFKGRGAIQLTGRANYARCSQALFNSERALLDNPELVAEPITSAASAAWYWDWKRLNRFADKRDLLGCTKVINGGTNGYMNRKKFYERALYALGI